VDLYQHKVFMTLDAHLSPELVVAFLNIRLELPGAFDYLPRLKRVMFKYNSHHNIQVFSFGTRLAKLLGFEPHVDYYLNGTYLAPYEMNLHGGVDYLCLYLPILDGEQVGPTRLPLLRMIPFEIQYPGQQRLTNRFTKPYYCRLNRSVIDSMRVITRDELGRHILYKSGKVFLTCHMRIRH
jgi:hypothetical protein